MAVPVYVGSGSGTVALGTSASATPHASTAIGDVLIGVVSFRAGVTKTIVDLTFNPAAGSKGWTRLNAADNSGSAGNVIQHAVWKYAEATDLGIATSCSWAGTVNSTAIYAVHTFTGCDPNFPFDIASLGLVTTGIGNGGLLPTPSIVTLTADTLLVAIATHRRGDTSFTAPGGMVERFDAGTGGATNNVRQTVATATQAAAGASGAKSFTVATGGSETGGSCLIALTGTNVTTGTAPVRGALTTARVNEPGPLTLDVPANTADGDLLVAMVAVRGGSPGALTEPSGWTEIARRGFSTLTDCLATYYRIASSEPASYDWSCTDIPEGFMAGGIQRIEKDSFDADQPIHGVMARVSAAGAGTANVGGGTPFRHNTLAIEFVIISGAVTVPTLTAPGNGETVDYQPSPQSGVTISMPICIAHYLQTNPNLETGSALTGGMRAQAFTYTRPAQDYHSHLILLGPAGATTPEEAVLSRPFLQVFI